MIFINQMRKNVATIIIIRKLIKWDACMCWALETMDLIQIMGFYHSKYLNKTKFALINKTFHGKLPFKCKHSMTTITISMKQFSSFFDEMMHFNINSYLLLQLICNGAFVFKCAICIIHERLIRLYVYMD